MHPRISICTITDLRYCCKSQLPVSVKKLYRRVQPFSRVCADHGRFYSLRICARLPERSDAETRIFNLRFPLATARSICGTVALSSQWANGQRCVPPGCPPSSTQELPARFKTCFRQYHSPLIRRAVAWRTGSPWDYSTCHSLRRILKNPLAALGTQIARD